MKLKTSASYSSLSPLSLWLDLTTHLCRNATTRALYYFFSLYSSVLELHCVAESEKKKRKNGNEPNKETKRKEEEEGKGLLDEASVVFFFFFFF